MIKATTDQSVVRGVLFMWRASGARRWGSRGMASLIESDVSAFTILICSADTQLSNQDRKGADVTLDQRSHASRTPAASAASPPHEHVPHNVESPAAT